MFVRVHTAAQLLHARRTITVHLVQQSPDISEQISERTCPCTLLGVLVDSLSCCMSQALTLALMSAQQIRLLLTRSMQSNHLATTDSRLTLPCAQLHVSRGCRAPSTHGNPLSAQSFRQQKQVLANPSVRILAAGVSPSRNAPVVRADMSASPFPSANEAEAAVAQMAVRLASRLCRVSCCRQTVLVRHWHDNKRFCAYTAS